MGDEHGHDDDEKECVDCQVPLILADVDYEWPEFGAICYGCLLKRYKAAPTPLVWSSERPKVAGEYCVRSKADHSERYCWNVGQFEIDFPPPWYSDFEFCLIPEPMELPL